MSDFKNTHTEQFVDETPEKLAPVATATETEPESELNPEEVQSLLAAMARKPQLIKGALAQRAAHKAEAEAVAKADNDLLKSLGYKTTRAPRKPKAPPVPGQPTPVPAPNGPKAAKKK